MILKNSRLFFGLLGLTYLLCLCVFWPGLMRPDSLAQLQQAQLNVFSDHHPPLMALYWRLLNFFCPGPGLLFATHLTLFFGAVCFFALSFRNTLWMWVYGAVLFWPPVFFYATFVLKDVGFTFSILFVSSVLTFYTLAQKKLPPVIGTALVILLSYGTGVKFQAVFVLPLMTLWVLYCTHSMTFSFKVFVRAFLLFGFVFGGVQIFNALITHEKSHAWQFVKLYDLAGISLREEKDLFPVFVKNNVSFTMENLKEKFSSERVDSLVFELPPVLVIGKTESERQKLWDTWFQAVCDYPLSFLTHRWTLFKHLLEKSPIKGLDDIQSHADLLSSRTRNLLVWCGKMGIIDGFKAIASFKFFAPFACFYLLLGLWFIRKNKYAVPLFFLNGIGLTLLGSLFIFSMASDPRYIYLTTCCFHFSHPFFFKVLKELKEKIRKRTGAVSPLGKAL